MKLFFKGRLLFESIFSLAHLCRRLQRRRPLQQGGGLRQDRLQRERGRGRRSGRRHPSCSSSTFTCRHGWRNTTEDRGPASQPFFSRAGVSKRLSSYAAAAKSEATRHAERRPPSPHPHILPSPPSFSPWIPILPFSSSSSPFLSSPFSPRERNDLFKTVGRGGTTREEDRN